jgi:hypothetical protein
VRPMHRFYRGIRDGMQAAKSMRFLLHREGCYGQNGQHSIRVNHQWRICFRWTPAGPRECRDCLLSLTAMSMGLKNCMRPVHPGEILREDF